MTDIRKTINNLLLERYVLGELPEEDAREIEDRLASEPELAQRVRAIKQSDERILAEYPPSIFAKRIEAKSKAPEKAASLIGIWRGNRRLRTAVYSFGCAAALACFFIALFPAFFPGSSIDYSMEESILVKGNTGLEIFRQTDNGYEQLADNASVTKGDRFQLKYKAGNAVFGAIFSIDGNGNVTLHFPDRIGSSPRLVAGGDVALLDAFELDDAPGFEKFFFVVSKSSFEVQPVLDKARALALSGMNTRTAKLELDPALAQVSLTLVKEGSR
jgi:hypothetical protein